MTGILLPGNVGLTSADVTAFRERFQVVLAAGTRSGHRAHCDCQPCQARSILTIISEPLGLPGEDLPSYGVPRPRCCTACLLGPLYKDHDVCLYCHSLADLHRTRTRDWQAPARRNLCQCRAYYGQVRRRTARLLICGALAGIAVMLLVLVLLGYILGGPS